MLHFGCASFCHVVVCRRSPPEHAHDEVDDHAAHQHGLDDGKDLLGGGRLVLGALLGDGGVKGSLIKRKERKGVLLPIHPYEVILSYRWVCTGVAQRGLDLHVGGLTHRPRRGFQIRSNWRLLGVVR